MSRWGGAGQRPDRRPALGGPPARAVLVTAALLAGALIAGRPDLVALTVPFVVGVLRQLRATPPVLALHLAAPSRTDELTPVEAVVTVQASEDADAVTVALAASPSAAAPRPVLVALRAGRPREVRFTTAAPRWGRRRTGPASAVALGHGLGAAGATASTAAVALDVLPRPEPFDSRESALTGPLRAGVHQSRSTGPGVEPVAVRPYAPGDRLRQVDWRTTSRTGTLHVRATSTDRSADIVVLLDALQDPGSPGASALDIAVRAATSLIEHHLALGDTVGLVQFGGRLRTLPGGSGRRQLHRARQWLLDVRLPINEAVAARDEPWVPEPRRRSALVVALTPLLDPRTAVLLAGLRRSGSAVVAVDVLPAAAVPAAPADAASADALARRLWLLERKATAARLGELGVPVVAWAGGDSLDPVLRALSRMAAAPRANAR